MHRKIGDLLYWLVIVWATYQLYRALYEKGYTDGESTSYDALVRARMTIYEMTQERFNAWKKHATSESSDASSGNGESIERNPENQEYRSESIQQSPEI